MKTIELIYQGLKYLFTLEPFAMMLFGFLIGLVFGSIPGFSSSNTAALMLPLTLGMSTGGAILFIGALYCSAQYGGGISSILLGIPGTTGSVCTVFDGFPMAKKGEADRALGLALFSSAIGGVISAIISIFLIYPISNFALAFGPTEMTLLALVGIVIIVSVLGEDIKKGLLAGFLGVLISTMSADPIYGIPRLSFGLFELYEKVPIVSIILGLFAFPSIIEMIGQETISVKGYQVGSNIFQGVIEAASKPFVYIRSSLIGLFVGIVPGAGIDIGSFLSYSQAKNFSRSPDTFGKGNPEGIIASESGNNGVTAGAMVPALTLGIPGGTTTAIMLSALTLHGVAIGPQVIKTNPREVYALLLGALVCSILILPLGWLYTKLAVKVSGVKMSYLIPVILILSLAGAFSYRNFMFDMYLCFIAGLIGIIMSLNKYPIAPLVLGFILGDIVEMNFVRAITISNGDLGIFLKGPICSILWIIIFLTLFSPILIKQIKKLK